jgi:hypothetical protein
VTDENFERELEIFRQESEGAAQFFYAYLAMSTASADYPEILEYLNRAPMFWNTCAGALQTASIIALARIFETNTPHNLGVLIRIARENPEIFSKAALGRRKQGKNLHRPEWVDIFLESVYEPKQKDFDRIGARIRKYRKIYARNYEQVRHKWYAHKIVAEPAEIVALFANTKIRELERLFAFLGSLYDALWELFFNGRKPVLGPSRYSLRRMRDFPSTGRASVQEHMTVQATRVLMLAANAKPKKKRTKEK